jgi:hypothetical protein
MSPALVISVCSVALGQFRRDAQGLFSDGQTGIAKPPLVLMFETLATASGVTPVLFKDTSVKLATS